MAFDKKPSTWLGAGYAVTSHVAGFNTNDASSNKLLTQITDANADPTTGDIRILTMAWLEMLYAKWLLQAGSQPTKMTITRSQGNNRSLDGSVQYTYTIKIQVLPSAVSVPSE